MSYFYHINYSPEIINNNSISTVFKHFRGTEFHGYRVFVELCTVVTRASGRKAQTAYKI